MPILFANRPQHAGPPSQTLLPRLRDTRGTTAVEFALVAPVFLALLLGIIGFGQIISVHHALQQLAAEAARASVAGLSDAERDTLARRYISANASAYVGLDGTRIQVSTTAMPAPQNATEVTLSYDLTDALIYRLAPTMLPDPTVRRSAAIQRGGY
jgi:Flp pilus assembly protein TadG